MSERIRLSEELRQRLLDPEQLPEIVKVRGVDYRLVEPANAGYQGVIWKADDGFGPKALKLAIYGVYIERSYLEELFLASRLQQYEEFARFERADVVTLPKFPDQQFVAIVEDWVDGLTLEKYLEQHSDRVTASFFVVYVKDLCKALQALRTHGLTHDDLHMRNVMLARPLPGSLSPEWRVKIVDTGSLQDVHKKEHGRTDDHRRFVEHLVAIWNTIYRRRILPIRERRFLKEAETLLKTMVDDDPSVALRDPGQIVHQFDMAHTRALSPPSQAGVQMRDPFEFISAEHIADDGLLVDIFAKSCPWLGKVDGPDPCLVTGPRGCGKSTIFRWLSLKAHLLNSVAQIEPRIVGFYISCSSDLQNRLGWIQERESADRASREIVHYFNLLAAREVVHTLLLITMRGDRESQWGFGRSQEITIHRFIMEALGAELRPRIQGVPHLEQAMEAIEAEMFETHSQMLRGLNIAHATPATFLGDLTTLLMDQVPAFRGKKITFLVDDFSDHRLPREVQRILNRIIWERRGSHVFKLSAEKLGSEPTDPFGATVDVTREMVEVDCGKEYIALDDARLTQQARAFATELLNLRLKKAGYRGTADTLIGPSRWPQRSLARALLAKRVGRSADAYHGLRCIADLCSGDISTVLFVYRKIFERGGVTKESDSKVPNGIQHAAIVSASRELLEAVKAHFPYGPKMYDVANSFGNFVRTVLEGREIKKGAQTVPAQCPRIEVDQKRRGVVHQLSDESLELATELVKRSVFIDMGPGLSRHGNVTTLRWHFRRIYLPAFGASLAKNDAVKEDPEWLKFLLTEPEAACSSELKKRGVSELKKRRISESDQQLPFENMDDTKRDSRDG